MGLLHIEQCLTISDGIIRAGGSKPTKALRIYDRTFQGSPLVFI